MEPALPPLPPLPDRRAALLALAAAAAAVGLAGCGSSPPVQLYHLRSEAPAAVPARVASSEQWQLLLPVRLPDYLDREAILLPEGQTGLLALSGHRWAESLRDAVPRVLRQDLSTLAGEGHVWTAPVPAGLTLTRQLRVEIVALQADADRRAVTLQARWTWLDPRAREAPRSDALTLRVPSASSSIDSLVAAHRVALWQLAERIAARP